MKKALLFLLIFALSIGVIAGCGEVEDYLFPYESSPTSIILPTVEPLQSESPAIESSGKPSDIEQPENEQPSSTNPVQENTDNEKLSEVGTYNSKDEVALYIYQYGKLPSNYINKNEARKLGWQGGSVDEYAPGKSIGGDRFGNYEGLLPEKKGRSYTECDIDTLGKSSRGAKRIVFSNDGLIYYTDNHYESFTLLYGEDIL